MADPFVEYKKVFADHQGILRASAAIELGFPSTSSSIQARLNTEAEQQGRPFAEILQYYVMERFLSRLSKSRYPTKFILRAACCFMPGIFHKA